MFRFVVTCRFSVSWNNASKTFLKLRSEIWQSLTVEYIGIFPKVIITGSEHETLFSRMYSFQWSVNKSWQKVKIRCYWYKVWWW